MRQIDQEQLAKTSFGIIQSLDEIFEGFMYCPNSRDPSNMKYPPGFVFCSGRETGKVITFTDPSPWKGATLAVKARAHTMAAIEARCCEGNLGSFSIIPWPQYGYALIHATDKMMIANPWVAFIALDKLPSINPTNTPTWDGNPI